MLTYSRLWYPASLSMPMPCASVAVRNVPLLFKLVNRPIKWAVKLRDCKGITTACAVVTSYLLYCWPWTGPVVLKEIPTALGHILPKANGTCARF